MSVKRILIVEDERIVAEDLKRLLEKMGYAVTDIAADGAEALEKARAVPPDLVLMDIRLQGPMDGIETAERLHAEHDAPVSYLTAYADAPTLERAKATMPYGYILKPFDARALQTVIELALHRHEMEAVLGKMDDWHARALNALPDAVVATNGGGRVIFLNKAAEALTGWTLEEIFDRHSTDLFDGALATALGPASPCVVRTKSGARLSVTCACSALPGDDGAPGGVLIVIKKK
jgi:CheY-like chemotaxis protein